MKIAVYSDLHNEYNNIPLNIPSCVDVVVFAGDIDEGVAAAEYCASHASRYPDKQFIFVPGNHEYYVKDVDMITINNQMRAVCDQIPNLHFLYCDRVVIDGVVFLGTPLFTNFGDNPVDQMFMSGRNEDFKYSATPDRYRNLYYISMNFLMKEVYFIGDDEKCVVVTHWPPLTELSNPRYPKSNSYVNNNLSGFINELGDNIDLWVYGHNHHSDVKEFGGVKFVSNQRGYGRHIEHAKLTFDENFYIEI